MLLCCCMPVYGHACKAVSYTNMCARTHTLAHTYAHAHAHAHTRMCVCVRTFTHAHTHTNTCTRTHARTRTHTRTRNPNHDGTTRRLGDQTVKARYHWDLEVPPVICQMISAEFGPALPRVERQRSHRRYTAPKLQAIPALSCLPSTPAFFSSKPVLQSSSLLPPLSPLGTSARSTADSRLCGHRIATCICAHEQHVESLFCRFSRSEARA